MNTTAVKQHAGEPPPNPWTNLLNQIHGKACPDVRAEESSPTASV